VGTGGERATTPKKSWRVFLGHLLEYQKMAEEVCKNLSDWAQYLDDSCEIDEEGRPDADTVEEDWYCNLLQAVRDHIGPLRKIYGGLGMVRGNLNCLVSKMENQQVRSSRLVLVDRGSSPVRVERMEVGIGPGPGIRPPPKRSVRSGTDPGPIKYFVGRGSSPIRLGVDMATSPSPCRVGETGTQTEIAGGADAPVGPKPRRVRSRGVQTDPGRKNTSALPQRRKRGPVQL